MCLEITGGFGASPAASGSPAKHTGPTRLPFSARFLKDRLGGGPKNFSHLRGRGERNFLEGKRGQQMKLCDFAFESSLVRFAIDKERVCTYKVIKVGL